MPTEIISKAIGTNRLERRYRVDYTEFVDASTTQTLDLVTLPASAVGISCVVNNIAAATDAGSISALGLEVGSAGDPNMMFTSVDMFGSTGYYQNVAAGSVAFWGGTTVKVKATATGANLGSGSATDLDSGSFEIILRYEVL